jgi:maltooligosyltrehalose trehalohydrolase
LVTVLPGGDADMSGVVWAAANPVAPRRMTAAESVFFMGPPLGSSAANAPIGQKLRTVSRFGLYQGQWSRWQQKTRGSPALDLPVESFVVFLQNHDQIANSGIGERCHAQTSPGRFRAMTAYFLLMPGIPMLFQGQEFASSSPFFYFADHAFELARDVREGRRTFLGQFPNLASSEMQAQLADPGDVETFRRSVLDLGERQRNDSVYALHRDLLALRREDPVLGRRPCRIDGAVLADESWMLRFFSDNGADRLLIVNLGRDLLLGPAPEPLLAPVEGHGWRLLWSSEAPLYGGAGNSSQVAKGNWLIPGQSATLLAPEPEAADIEANSSAMSEN